MGRLVKAATSNTRTVNSYNAMGQIATQWQCTPQNCGSGWYSATYAYNLAGAVTSQSNPFGFTLAHAYNAAARLTTLTSSLNDAQHPATLASNFSYHPHGAVKLMTYGNGLVGTMAFNNRLQPCRITVVSSGTQPVLCTDPAANFLDFTYGYNHGVSNNGNVIVWNASGKQVFTRSYGYDELNRIASMSGSNGNCTSMTWTYDVWGNRTNQTTAVGGGACTEHHPTVLTNNRISELGYDVAGNVTSDPATSASYAFDAENRMVASNSTLGNASYVYDADGKRIQKTVDGLTTEFVYDAAGSVAAERKAGAWTKAYIMLGGQMLAQYDNTANPTTTYFAHKDHLGSSRLLTGVSQSVIECDGYQPFGELDTSVCNPPTSTSTTTYKFTGQERDTESGLDNFGARYFGSNLGRFMSPDDFWKDSHVGDPQSWNKYTYARNNPLRYIDPTGEEATVSTQCDNDKKTCQVNVSATISIYTNDTSISQEKLNEVAAKIKSDVEKAWSGSFTQDGVTYNITTSVSVTTAENESKAIESGAQNVIEIANEGPKNQVPPNLTSGPDRGFLKISDVLQTPAAAHEFAHLLGVDDKGSRNLSNTDLVEGGWATVAKASQQDFRWALGPTLKGNSWLFKGGRRNPDGSRTIGPPFKNEPWWK
jgi:RHS repeat-associated protein